MVGQTVAHYRIIGADGVAQVYRATDTKLDRAVALIPAGGMDLPRIVSIATSLADDTRTRQEGVE